MNRQPAEWKPRSRSWTSSPPPTTSSRSNGSSRCPRREMRPIPIARLLRFAGLAAALTAGGCATAPRLGKAVPDELQAAANVVGFPVGIRYFPRDAGHVVEFERDFLASNDRERARLQIEKDKPLPPNAFLAISGGGDNGAF